ncbi:GGDEF domain-containing protein [Pelomonas sp. KK5]|uniref:GGDEF domain-containing protein n=1 Tax=Pelomonas sp. KK5 TaxID=1855730 RepID=UPI00097C2958|nr:GGDEF domain-containing protein [Pelomonas sp. KK5]
MNRAANAFPRRHAGRARARLLARACLALALGAGLLPLLSGCPSAASQASSPEDLRARAAEVMRRVNQLERTGVAQPAAHEAELQDLLRLSAPGSPERIEVLTMAGNLAALAQDRIKLDAAINQLMSWPAPATQAQAKLALAFVEGQYFYKARQDIREARKALAGIDAETFRKAPLADLIRVYNLRAFVKHDAGEIDEALADGHQALRYAQELGEDWRIAHTLIQLALFYYKAEQGERARQTEAEAARIVAADPDPFLSYRMLTISAMLHSRDEDTSATQKAWLGAIDQAARLGADSLSAQANANLSDYYLHAGKFQRALQQAEIALPLARRTRNLNAEITARQNLGLAKIALGRVAEGKVDTRAAITLDEQQGATSGVTESWQELGEYLERAGDYTGAIEAHHEYRRLIDVVLRDDTRKAVLEAQEHYDASQRLKEIELLNRDNSLKTEQIRARDLELELWASLAGCIVVTSVLMGLFYQRVRRTNEALAHSNATLKVQSERDPLTGLANRRHFQAAIREATGDGKLKGSLFLIDIDHFKRINDVHGHAAGDSVLVEVARRLRSAVREDDLVVRWGGEEFLIFARTREQAYAQGLAQRLLDLIGQPVVHSEYKRIPTTASIGFASFPMPPHELSMGWERAIDLVDTVMYMAKAHGRNKAYGIEHVGAVTEDDLARITTSMEAACHEGRLRLVALQGPVRQGEDLAEARA